MAECLSTTLFSRTSCKRRRMGEVWCFRNHAFVRPIHVLCESDLCTFRTVQSMDRHTKLGSKFRAVQSMDCAIYALCTTHTCIHVCSTGRNVWVVVGLMLHKHLTMKKYKPATATSTMKVGLGLGWSWAQRSQMFPINGDVPSSTSRSSIEWERMACSPWLGVLLLYLDPLPSSTAVASSTICTLVVVDLLAISRGGMSFLCRGSRLI